MLKREKKIKTPPKHNPLENIIGYLLSLTIAFIFALFCSWRIGIFLMFSFILAPILSIIITLIFSKVFQFQVEPSKTFVGKNEKFYIQISVKNPFPFPTPSILFYTSSHPCVSYDAPTYALSVMPFQTEQFLIPCTAKIGGQGQMGIANIKLQDYLGIFTLSLKKSYTYQINIVPDIAEISPDEDFIRQTYILSSTNGESDETVEVTTNVMGAFPGYEHREYVPGDPLKRINWKLSAKKEKLFIRLDDELATSTVMIIIDPLLQITENDIERLPMNMYAETDHTILPYLICENVLEYTLGIAQTLLSRNLNVYCYYQKEGRFTSMHLVNAREITLLQQELAAYCFEKEIRERFPINDTPKEGAVCICTPNRFTDIPFQGIIVYSALDGKGRQL